MTITEVRPEHGGTRIDEARRDAFVERLFGALLGGSELLAVEVGRRLGLYEAIRGHDAGSTPRDVGGRTGVVERYAREWLEQQAASGVLDVVADSPDGRERRYALDEAHAVVLLDPDDPAAFGAGGMLLLGLAQALPAVVEAYRTGRGVGYAAYGEGLRDGLAAFNRPVFANDVPGWVDALGDVGARLRRDGGQVLDLGCGTGRSSVALARALPLATVDAVDLDAASVATAEQVVAEAGLGGRVRVRRGDATDDGASGGGPYDLVAVLEALHDMAHPVAALRSVRERLADGGCVLVADEKVAEEFVAPADEAERLQYMFSALHCLPSTVDELPAGAVEVEHPEDGVAHGTVLREPTMRDWAARAGFGRVETLEVENDFWRFYRLDG